MTEDCRYKMINATTGKVVAEFELSSQPEIAGYLSEYLISLDYQSKEYWVLLAFFKALEGEPIKK